MRALAMAIASILAVGLLAFAAPAPHASAAGALDGKVVVLDPGHGGSDTAALSRQVPNGRDGTKPCGTTGTSTDAGYPEHVFAWEVANLVRARLEQLGATVVMTRNDDDGSAPCVDARAAIANAQHPAAIVSIHADGAPASGHGFHVNYSNPPLNDSQGAPSLRLAAAMRDALVASGVAESTYLGTDGLYGRADLAGLNLATYPAVLVELGNMRNADDAARMTSDEGRAGTPQRSSTAPSPTWAGDGMPSHSAGSRRFPLGLALLAGVVVVALIGGGLFVLTKTGVLGGESTTAGEATTEAESPAAEPARTPAPAPAPAAPAALDLTSSFDAFNLSISAPVGVVLQPIGGGAPLVLGPWSVGAAWSTSKVPLSIAALRADPAVGGTVSGAITTSDNASAEALWSGLGDPVTAAGKVEAVLAEAGDTTPVSSVRSAGPEFSAFGQTQWPLIEQARFMSFAACSTDPATTQVLDLMGQISGSQRWGLGGIADTRFKGGWGPSDTGYLVRQLGIIRQGDQMTAVAVASASSSFDQGTSDLDAIAGFLRDHLGELPMGRCAAA